MGVNDQSLLRQAHRLGTEIGFGGRLFLGLLAPEREYRDRQRAARILRFKIHEPSSDEGVYSSKLKNRNRPGSSFLAVLGYGVREAVWKEELCGLQDEFIQVWDCWSALVASGAVRLQAAQPTPTDSKGRPLYQAGVVVVKLKSESAQVVAKALPLRFGISSLDAVSNALGVQRVEPMFRSQLSKTRSDLPDLSRIYRVTLPDGADVRNAVRLFGGDPAVAYAEPIPAHYVDETPDDPDFNIQSFLGQIMAEAAWDVHKGEEGAEVIVGIADSGVEWRHEDLVENIYQNLGEDADGDGKVIEESGDSWVFDPDDINGIDDDGNGYTDDFVGWNFLNDDELEDNDPDDPSGHGTHVAGLAAGRTNNGIGIASISWNVKILSASAANTASDGTIERGLNSVVYLAENGADVINMSWGGDGTSQFQQEVMEYASGLGSLLVAAAGNERTTDPPLSRAPCRGW